MSWLIYELIIGLIIGWWMYSDAKKRKLDNPSVWLWLGILFGIFGLLTYIIWHILPKNKQSR